MNLTIPLTLTSANVRIISKQILADIMKNGSFSLDITDYVKTIDNIVSDLLLKSGGSVIGKPCANTATISLYNNDALFSPNNPNNIESQYENSEFRINTPIKILIGFVDENEVSQTRELFNGYITSMKGQYSGQDRVMVLNLKDQVKKAMGMKSPNHSLKEGVYYEAFILEKTLSEAVDYLIDYCYGTSQARSIHTLTVKYPIIEFPIGDTVWASIQRICEATCGQAYFENGTFYFKSPLSVDYSSPGSSQFTFTGESIFSYTEDVDEANIKNKWEITSNYKTVQPRRILVGTPSTTIITSVENYKFDDGKSALDVDNKTIILKYQEGAIWIDTINVPLVDTTCYIDLVAPTAEDIVAMNEASVVKVWDKSTNTQLTINDIDCDAGTIELLNTVNPATYDLQITYQHYNNRIISGKYKWYTFEFDRVSISVESPIVVANNGLDDVIYSWVTSSGTLYLSDWELLDGNMRVKYKLTNNVPVNGIYNKIFLTKMETYGFPLESVSPLKITAVDVDSIDDFENSYTVQNDFFISPEWSKEVVDWYLFKYKQNITILNADVIGIPQADMLDRVSVNEPSSGINLDFSIIGIKHSVSANNEFKTSLILESLSSPWTYDPTRVSSTIYQLGTNYLSLYLFTDPDPPTNLTLSELTYVQPSGEVVSRIDVSFNPVEYPYYGHSFVQYSVDNTNWFDVGPTIDGEITKNGVIANVTYYIRVRTVSLNGRYSDWISTSLTVVGKDTPPSNVSKMNITQSNDILKATIIKISDPDVRFYEIRTGPTWDQSTLVITFDGNSNTASWQATQEGVQTFWVKACDNSGNYSTNATQAVITVMNLPEKNIIVTSTPDISTWTQTNGYIDPWGFYQIRSDQVIGDYTYFADIFGSGHTLSDTTELILPTIDLGAGVIAEGYFYVDDWGVIRLQTVEKISDYTDFFDIFEGGVTYMEPQYKVDTYLTISVDYGNSPNNFINIYYRTSFDGTAFGEWFPILNNQFIGRYVQVKLSPGSFNDITNVSIEGATVTVDVPDLEQIIEDIDIAAEAQPYTVTFVQDFFDVPTSIALYTMDTTGKMATWKMTNVTNEGFDLEILNSSGTNISGNLIKCVARGY